MLTLIQKVALGGGLVAVSLLAAYWALLFLAQRSILFPAPRLAGAHRHGRHTPSRFG